MEFSEVLERCLNAVDAEIEAVRTRPARDVLADGRLQKRKEPVEGAYYMFASTQQGLKFAEVVTARYEGSVYETSIADSDDETVTLHLPESVGNVIDRIDLEWENDFVLRKLRDQLAVIEDEQDDEIRARVMRVLRPAESGMELPDLVMPDTLNDRQSGAFAQSQCQAVTFIWGPPGTGKTSTLGPIMAGFMNRRKRVLFVSNTNRAVDVGLLSAIPHLDSLDRVYRLGDPALDDPRLEACRFERVAEAVREQFRAEILTAPSEAEAEALADRLGALEYSLMRQAKLVATTLAKVCTSDLLSTLEFDAVVLDEASMASLPYVMVVAAKAVSHLVVAGDPMQLPPISQSESSDARKWMETDIYALASGATSPSDLFKWHDRNPTFTSFFDTQYRMQADLSDLISKVFYEGRLKGAAPVVRKRKPKTTVRVIDTSPLEPSIRSRPGSGFQPVNDVHQGVVRDLVTSLVLKDLVNPYEIGVVVPFRSAVWDIRQILKNEGFTEVEVGTVHTFQGREKQVIIFDTVMSGMRERGIVRHFAVRPFDEAKSGLQVPRLLNVAFSRAKSQLYLIADLDHMRTIYARKFLGNLIGIILRQSPP